MSNLDLDLDLVRAEIKSWERDFASRHGRDPSVQDIRDQPRVAEKYKLYKKLSKALPKSRPVNPAPPLPRSNPFSPSRKTVAISATYPLATPAKNSSESRPCPSTPSSDQPHPQLPSAISRARKRLRGEPVSPSPSKVKRQRIRSQPAPSFPNLDQDSSVSEHEADQDVPTFVADSPVKAPAGGKSFKILFDDALPALSIPNKSASSVEQFDPRANASRSQTHTDPPVTTSLKLRHDLASKSIISGLEQQANRELFPTKDHLIASSSHKFIFPTVVSGVSQQRTSTKRVLESNDLAREHTEFGPPSCSQYPLIPPSPPLEDSFGRDSSKTKAKPFASRKKSRAGEEESDQAEDSPDDTTLKIAAVSLDRHKRSHRHSDELDWDLLLHLGTHNHDTAARRQNHHASGASCVDLPDNFRRVLAISPPRSENSKEERVVRGLLYGDRVGHYDPSRGGDIWDAGETNDTAYGDIETEDDWEAEPVPWEVGEL